MRYYTKTDFYKLAKVTRQTIYNAIKTEKVVVGKSGKIDINNKTNKEYLETRGISVKPKIKKTKPNVKKKKKVNSKPKNKKTEETDKQKTVEQKNLNDCSRNDLDKLKIAADIRQKQVKTEKDREMLIPKVLIQKVFSKLYMIDVNQWRTLGPGLAPEIASIVGIDDNEIILKISDKIDEDAFKILKQVKRLFNDFLKGINGDV